MNFALPAIVAFFIVLPGFAFRSKLQLVDGTKVDYSPFGQVVTEAVLWAIILHAIMLWLSHVLFGQTLHIDVLLRLLSGGASEVDQALIAQSAKWVAAYFCVLLVAAVLLASALRFVVSQYRLDRNDSKFSSLFRFRRAPWYYLLSGADFDKGNEPDLIQIAAVVALQGESYIYQGILEHYYTDAAGQLDRLVISNASRRALKDDDEALIQRAKVGLALKSLHRRSTRPKGLRFYPIIGDYFILHYDEIATLNVRYIKLEPE